MKKCECEVCTRIANWKAMGVPEEFIDYVLDVEMDRDYYKAILDGDWPNARDRLQEALNKMEERNETTNAIF